MAIISRNNKQALRYGSSQMRYGLVYVLVTLLVLLTLNVYCSKASQKIFYQSKQTDIQDKTLMVCGALEELDVLNSTTVSGALQELGSLNETRLLVTDRSGRVIYDSLGGSDGAYCLYPEVVQALQGNDVFYWTYHDGVSEARSSAPILSSSSLSGCVYLMECDTQQGALIKTLQYNILTISLLLILGILLFTGVYSVVFTRRLRKIMTSIQVIREGDYSHKVKMGGRDELSVLGREFNSLTDRLYESENLRRQFVSDASHELKTPLASIKLLADSILQNDMDPDTVREFVTDIGEEADRLTRMSSKMLSLSKADSGPAKDCEITFVAPTVARVTRMLSAVAQQAQVTIRTETVRDSAILILEDDLYQIIFNLAENGIKYNLPGGTLTIRLLREGDNAVIQFTDTGMGIPQESLGRIFERFYRVDKARSRMSGGSGLGLAIVHDMVLRNRGVIRVESSETEPRGTTFTVAFPVFDTELEEDEP